MAFVNLKKTVEKIRWSDEPGAKEYEIDFSDTHVAKLQEIVLAMQKELDGAEEDAEKVADIQHRFIASVVSEECYRDALEYVDERGQGAAECNIAMSALVASIAEIVAEHMGVEQKQRLQHYIGDSDGVI